MYDPERRITAVEAMEHPYFKSVPRPPCIAGFAEQH
jgi:hypothetical protein